MIMRAVLFFITLVLLSCRKDDSTSLLVELPPFTGLELNSTFDVYLTDTPTHSIEIVGNQRRVEQVVVEMVGNTIKVKDEANFKWINPKQKPVQLYVNCDALAALNINETCLVQTTNTHTTDRLGIVIKGKANEANLDLNCNSVYYWNNHPTGGKLTLSGVTSSLKVWNFAIMSVDAKNLITNYALIENNAQGNCEVNVLDKLEYSISNVGDVHLYGEPAEIIEKELTSTGRLVRF